jgi:alpha-L-fucosidase 2
MNYWASETTNLSECHEPLMDFIEELSRAGIDPAAEYYDCRGWCVHHNIDLWRSTWPVGAGEGSPAWANWPMAGVWRTSRSWSRATGISRTCTACIQAGACRRAIAPTWPERLGVH